MILLYKFWGNTKVEENAVAVEAKRSVNPVKVKSPVQLNTADDDVFFYDYLVGADHILPTETDEEILLAR